MRLKRLVRSRPIVNGGPTDESTCFLPVPTKSFLEMSPDAAMLFAPFGYTHPPPPIPLSFWRLVLLKQNQSPKDIAGSNLMKLKVSWHYGP